MAKVAKQGMKKRAAKAYKMPDPIPQGEILEDIFKKKWKLGTFVGQGGFGEIYSAQPYTEKSSAKSGYPYVIKIEPHENGPLFVEMHFYMRCAKKVEIDAFMASKKLQSLGMPVYIGSGTHEYKGVKYRFVVMEKYGSDLVKLFLEYNKFFPVTTVFKIGLQILDVLEYIHSKGYIHGDIKGANIVLGLSNPNQVYLVDFGLAEHYSTAVEFKPNPKKAHNGTIEYLSRDAHLGVQTRRGDLEVLIYNLIQWLGCSLPWENVLKDTSAVQKSKEKHMSDIPEFLKTCFGSRTPPDAIKEYLKKLLATKFNAEPNYDKFRSILLAGLKSAGGSLKTPLEFEVRKTPNKRRSNTKVSSSPGKKRKLNKRAEAKDSNDKLIESDQESDENHEDDLTVKRKNSKHSKKIRVSSEEESNEESDNGNDGDMKVLSSRGRRAKAKASNDKLIESDQEPEENHVKNSKRSKKIRVSSEGESTLESDNSNDDYLPQKRRQLRSQLTKNKVKKKLDESECSDDNTLATLKRQKVKRQLRNVKSNEKDEALINGKLVKQKQAEEKCSDDSDTSTYTAEMRRIKNKMKLVKVSKPRKQRLKKSDVQNVDLLPSASASSDKNGDVISNSDDDLPLSITRSKKAKK